MRCDASPCLSPSLISAVYANVNLLPQKGMQLELGLPVHHAFNADYGVRTSQSIDTATARRRAGQLYGCRPYVDVGPLASVWRAPGPSPGRCRLRLLSDQRRTEIGSRHQQKNIRTSAVARQTSCSAGCNMSCPNPLLSNQRGHSMRCSYSWPELCHRDPDLA